MAPATLAAAGGSPRYADGVTTAPLSAEPIACTSACLQGDERVQSRSLGDVVAAFVGGGAFGAVTWRAVDVQMASPRVGWWGVAVGAAVGTLVWRGQVSPGFAFAGVGAIGFLQFFRCWMCDGSPYLMPALAAVAATFCWLCVHAGLRAEREMRSR